ncbi:MAG: hypothetical protein JWM96_37 [Alphaproteobacteria bacterium]|nr:hypothetical protein [Alphaproteobacteria bacterium]
MDETKPAINIQHMVTATKYSTRYVPDKARLSDLKFTDDPILKTRRDNENDEFVRLFWMNWQFSHPLLEDDKPVDMAIETNACLAYWNQTVCDVGFFPRAYKQNDKLQATTRALIYQNMLEKAPPAFKQDIAETGEKLLTNFRGTLETIITQAEEFFGPETVGELRDYIGQEFNAREAAAYTA